MNDENYKMLIPSITDEWILFVTANDCHFNGYDYPELVDDDFYFDATQKAFKRMKMGANYQTQPADVVLSAMGQKAFYEVFEATPNNVHAFDHILPALRDLRFRRESVFEASKNIKSFIDLSIPFEQKTGVRALNDGLAAVSTDAKRNRKGFMHSKWLELQSITGGFRAGQLVGIVGESESGKTTIAKNLLHHLLLDVENLKAGVISLEESEEDFVQSVVCISKKISRKELIWRINNDENFSLTGDGNSYGGWKDVKFSYDAYSLEQIRSFIKSHRPHIVMIDHAQFVHNDGTSLGPWINKLCNTLKEIAKEFQCCIVILSQIDKDAAKFRMIGKQAVKRLPTLADAWGGIGFKSSLDAGFVICRDKDKSIIYCDKCRKPWDTAFRYTKFEVTIDGGKQLVNNIRPMIESKSEDEEITPWWDKL
jgi:KaiC/GvpD/RAD55 family RecA-like ATPase